MTHLLFSFIWHSLLLVSFSITVQSLVVIMLQAKQISLQFEPSDQSTNILMEILWFVCLFVCCCLLQVEDYLDTYYSRWLYFDKPTSMLTTPRITLSVHRVRIKMYVWRLTLFSWAMSSYFITSNFPRHDSSTMTWTLASRRRSKTWNARRERTKLLHSAVHPLAAWQTPLFNWIIIQYRHISKVAHDILQPGSVKTVVATRPTFSGAASRLPNTPGIQQYLTKIITH